MKILKKYGVFLIIFSLCLTPVIWFWGRGKTLITGVDTNFPLDPLVWFMRRFFVWSSVSNGGSDFSSSVAGIFFHFIQVVPYILGFGLQQVEVVSLIFWFSLIIFSAFIFSRTFFPGKPLVQLLFVVFYAFNIYLFNTWENVKVANLALVAAMPLGLTIFQRLGEGGLRYYWALFYASLIGVVLLGAGINPAYFSTFLVSLVIFWMARVIRSFNTRAAFKETVNLQVLVIPIILVNLFWILPTFYFIFSNISSGDSITQIGFRNWVDSVSQNTSLLNVMRMQGAWDWYAADPETRIPFYIPYSINYFHSLPFLFFSFLIPLLAILAFLFRDKEKNYLYVAFGTMFLLGVFLGSGTHSPTGTIYNFLSGHVPFFTLFRSPWYIFTPLVSLSIAALLGLLFFTHEVQSHWVRIAVKFFIISLITGNLVYSYPLIEGKIFRPGRGDSFYVNFPEYVFEAKNKLSLGGDGRVLSYPDDRSENFTWGYRGIDSILGLMLDREAIFMPFYNESSPIARVIAELYTSLGKGETEAFLKIAGKLNVSLIFHKSDQKSFASPLPQQIFDLKSERFGSWLFYELPKEAFLPKIYSATGLFLTYPYNLAEQVFGVMQPEELILNPKDNMISNISSIKNGGKIIIADNSQVWDIRKFQDPELSQTLRIIAGDVSRVDFVFVIPEEGEYQPVLEKYKLDYFGIEIEKGLETELDGRKVVLTANIKDNSYVRFNPLWFSAGEHKISFNLHPRNMVVGGELDNLEILDKRGGEVDRGQYEVVGSDEDRKSDHLSILNTGSKTMGVKFRVPEFDPFSSYYIEVKHRHVYGNVGRLAVFQPREEGNAKIHAESLPNYPEWRTFHTYFEPDSVESGMEVELGAPSIGDPLGTKILYDDLRVYRVFSNRLFLVNRGTEREINSPDVEFKKISPVLYEGTVRGNGVPHVIVFSENYSPGWTFDAPYAATPVHFSANLYGNAWYVEGAPSEYKFKIYYQPQKLLLIGAVISIAVVISSGLFFLWGRLKVRKGRSDERQN